MGIHRGQQILENVDRDVTIECRINGLPCLLCKIVALRIDLDGYSFWP